MTLAEQFEAGALGLRAKAGNIHGLPLHVDGRLRNHAAPCEKSGFCLVRDAENEMLEAASLLDRAAELARDNERVVQSIVARDVP
jgi:hypothetical protein